MNAPPAAGRESRPAGNQGRREFLALMAAASATVAISIDVMLPAFGELREYLGLPSDSSSVALVVTVFLIVPTLAPILGQTLLSFGSWRYTFAVGPVFGMLVALWS